MAKRSLSKDCKSGERSKIPKYNADEVPLSPSKISSTAQKTDVEGIIRSISVSPHRDSFFDGELSDGEGIVRFVGYDKKHINKLKEFYTTQEPCKLRSAMITESKNGKPQVVVKSYSKIGKSENNFTIPDITNDGSTSTLLSKLSNFDDYDRVTVCATVVKK